MSIQEKVENELRRHIERQKERVKSAAEASQCDVEDEELMEIFHAEFLTGASQVVRWLITNEGSDKLTPQIIERAIVVVGKERGFTVG